MKKILTLLMLLSVTAWTNSASAEITALCNQDSEFDYTATSTHPEACINKLLNSVIADCVACVTDFEVTQINECNTTSIYSPYGRVGGKRCVKFTLNSGIYEGALLTSVFFSDESNVQCSTNKYLSDRTAFVVEEKGNTSIDKRIIHIKGTDTFKEWAEEQ